MLEIHYSIDDYEIITTYEDVQSFLSTQHYGNPALKEEYNIIQCILSGEEIELPEPSVKGLLNYFSRMPQPFSNISEMSVNSSVV